MKKKHDGTKNVVTFKEGDFASLAIPAGDRTALDDHRMFVKIIKVPRDNIYILQCEHGILNHNVGITSLNTVVDDMVRRIRELIDKAPTKKISLHAAA